MKKIGYFMLLLVSLLQFLVCPLEASAEMNVNSNNSTIETISTDNIITDSSLIVDDTSYIYNNNNDRCPPTGEKKDKINDILLALILLIVITAIAIISKFISDENHRDDNK